MNVIPILLFITHTLAELRGRHMEIILLFGIWKWPPIEIESDAVI